MIPVHLRTLALAGTLSLTGSAGGAENPPLNVYSAGAGTVFEASSRSYSLALKGIPSEERLAFQVGDSLFSDNWVIAPSSTTGRDGLGPLFNTRGCSGCHLKDGRGKPPAGPDDAPVGWLIRLSYAGQDGDGQTVYLPDPNYGGQIQNRAIPGVPAEARIAVHWETVRTEQTGPDAPASYPDGPTPDLRRLRIELRDAAYGPFVDGLLISPRLAPPVIGLGLLEAIPQEAILANADPEDADGDGVSGRPNHILHAASGTIRQGRFGWKANQPDLNQQNAGAFLGDLGITTPLFNTDNCTGAQSACLAAPAGGTPEDPELNAHKLERVNLYIRLLAVPARRNWEDPAVRRGDRLFTEAACDSCHTRSFTTGSEAAHELLKNQTIFPYTDLLLHDMGPALADGRPDGEATGQEWRTPPLWGIGLTGTVNGSEFFMHDGRARTLEEAILWHGGEGTLSRNRFMTMTRADREALLAFLGSL